MKHNFFSRVVFSVALLFAFSFSVFAGVNPYASDLTATLSANQQTTTIHYRLNDAATKVEILFSNGRTYTTTTASEISKGVHNIVIDNSDYGFTSLEDITWSVRVTGAEHSGITTLSSGKDKSIYAPRGIDINQNPEHPYFGQVLVTESNHQVYVNNKSGYISSGYGSGIYRFYSDLTAYQNEPYTIDGGYAASSPFAVRWKDGTTAQRSPFRIRYSADGRLFTTLCDDAHNATVYEIPALGENWTEVISLANAGPNIGFDTKGSGANLRLMTLSGTISSGNNVSSPEIKEWDLGTATSISAASNSFTEMTNIQSGSAQSNVALTTYVKSNIHTGLQYAQRGGYWLVNGSDTNPKLVWYNPNNPVQTLKTWNVTLPVGGAVRFNADSTRLAVSYNKNNVLVYSVTYSTDDVPLLNILHDITVYASEANATDMAFDYANNLYIVDSSKEFLKVFGTSNSGDNVRTTPAPSAQAIRLVGSGSATSLVLKPDTVPMILNGTEQLEVSFTPFFASLSLSWTSSNTNVATVSSTGLVTASSSCYGMAEITATDAVSGLSATCKVYVAPEIDLVATKIWDYSTEDDPTDANLLYSSNNKNVITAAGRRDTIFLQNLKEGKVYTYHWNGSTVDKAVYVDGSGVGPTIGFDDKGNMFIRQNAYNTQPKGVNIYKDRHNSVDYSVNFDFSGWTSHSACWYQNAEGDFFSTEGGSIYYFMDTHVMKVRIINGSSNVVSHLASQVPKPGSVQSNNNLIYPGSRIYGGGDMKGLILHCRSYQWKYWDGTYKTLPLLDKQDISTLGGAIFNFENTKGDNAYKEVWVYPSIPPEAAHTTQATKHYYTTIAMRNMTDNKIVRTIGNSELYIGSDVTRQMEWGSGNEANIISKYKNDKYSYYVYSFVTSVGMAMYKIWVAPFYGLRLFNGDSSEPYKTYSNVPGEPMTLDEPDVCSNINNSTLVGWTLTPPVNYGWETMPLLEASSDGAYRMKYPTDCSANIDLYCVWQISNTDGSTHYASLPNCGDPLDIVDWSESSITVNLNEFDMSSGKSPLAVGSTIDVDVNGGSKQTISLQTDKTATMSASVLTPNAKVLINAEYEDEPFSTYTYNIPKIYSTNTTLSTGDLVDGTSIVVRDDAVLTVAGNLTVQNMTVYPNATLIIESGAQLTVQNRLVLRSDIHHTAQMYNAGTLSVPTKKFLHSKIVANKTDYHFLGLPFDCYLSDILLSTGRGSADGVVHNKKYRIKYYDGANRATKGGESLGKNWMTISDDKIKGKVGYEILSASAWYREYLFPMTYEQRDLTAQSVAVTAHPTTHTANHEGWNLCTSPFTSNYNGTITYAGDYGEFTNGQDQYVTYYREDGSYFQSLATIGTLPPFTPFFLQAKTTGNLQFAAPGKPTVYRVIARTNGSQTMDIVSWLLLNLKSDDMTDEEGTDMTALRINDSYSSAYETGLDLEKMIGTGLRPQVYTIQDGQQRAFNALSYKDTESQVRVGYIASTEGNYTFSLDESLPLGRIQRAYLIDSETGIAVDLLEQDYMFYSEAGTYNERFMLRFDYMSAHDVMTEVENVQTTAGEISSNAKLTLYDISGRVVYKGNLHGLLQIGAPNGVYILQIEETQNTWTEKILLTGGEK